MEVHSPRMFMMFPGVVFPKWAGLKLVVFCCCTIVAGQGPKKDFLNFFFRIFFV